MRLNLTLCVKCVILCVYLVLLLHSDDKMTVSATTSYIVQVDASTYDDAVAIEGEVGAVNYAFGHIEATTTQILDYDQLLPFTVDIPPMFTQTDDVQWIPAENMIQITYKSVAGSGSGASAYKRILYLQKNGQTLQTGDSANGCLTAATPQECWNALSAYELSSDADSVIEDPVHSTEAPTRDYIIHDGDQGVVVDSTTEDGVSEETLTIKIPLGHITGDVTGQTVYGERRTITTTNAAGLDDTVTYYDIGVGMLFWPDGVALSKSILFDRFQLVEDSAQNWQVEKNNQYTLARHVNLQYLQREADLELQNNENRIVAMQFVLQSGHTIAGIDVAIQHATGYRTILTSDCDHLKSELASLGGQSCLTTLPICESQVSVITLDNPDPDTAAEMPTISQSVVSHIVPVPPWFDAVAMSNELALSVSLRTCESQPKDDGTGEIECIPASRPLLSMLNFAVNTEPTKTCRNAVTQTFSPIDHVVLDVFGKKMGDELTLLESCEGSAACNVQPLFMDGAGSEIATYSNIQALLLVSIHPASTEEASLFFEATNDQTRLDQLYVTHQKSDATFYLAGADPPTRTIDANDRVTLTLDATLLQQCPLETDDLVIEGLDCITTSDYQHSGPQVRPVSHAQWVHKLQYQGSFVISEEDFDANANFDFAVSTSASFWLHVQDTLSVVHDDSSPSAVVEDTTTTVQIWTGNQDLTYKVYKVSSVNDQAVLTLSKAGTDKQITLSESATCNTHVAADVAFLETWYGPETTALTDFYLESLKQLPQQRHSCLYWVLPMYNWPGSVLGLVDKSMLFLAWSVEDVSASGGSSGSSASAPSPSPPGAYRRLLQTAPAAAPVDVSDFQQANAHVAGAVPALQSLHAIAPIDRTVPNPVDKKSMFTDPELLKRVRLTHDLTEVSRACGNAGRSISPSPAPTWRGKLQKSLCCETRNSPGRLCESVQFCNSSDACVKTLVDAVVALNLTLSVQNDSHVTATFLRSIPNPTSSTNVSSDSPAPESNASSNLQYFLETPAPFSTEPLTTPPPQTTSVPEPVSTVSKSPTISAALYDKDQCGTAQRMAQNDNLHVLAVAYDASVPPPLELRIEQLDGRTTCNLPALVRAIQSTDRMMLVDVMHSEAIFVSSTLREQVKFSALQWNDLYHLFHAVHNKSHSHPHDAESFTSNSNSSRTSSFFVQPRATLQMIHNNQLLNSSTTDVRVEMACGGSVYREQISRERRTHRRAAHKNDDIGHKFERPMRLSTRRPGTPTMRLNVAAIHSSTPSDVPASE